MIEAMTNSNDNESAQLTFPIQLNDKINPQQSDDDLAAELRVRIAHNLNRVNRGEREMDNELIEWITDVNAILGRGGYDPVPVDFSKFGVDQPSKLCLVNLTNI